MVCVHFMIFLQKMRLMLLCALAGLASGAVVNFEDAGAVPCKKTLFKSCDTSTEGAVKNAALFNATMNALAPGDTLLVPNSTYLMMGGIIVTDLTDATLQIEGTLLFSDDCDAWPTEIIHGKPSKSPLIAMLFERSVNLLITSREGTGTLDGNGAAWWGVPGVGYLVRGKNRPPLLVVHNATDFVLEHILLTQAPRFNFQSQFLKNATIRYCQVSARRTSDDGHSAIDLTAFNTDGFDVGGTDIHIHDCDVWNQDDTFCIKANHETTSNVLVENCRASGVGLSVGSIGDANVRNVTFRNVEMHHTSKGVYVKFNAKAARGGVVEDVTYENVHIEKPESWPIWIGPQQAGIKEANTTYNPCHGDPCSLCWPADKSSTCPPVVGATIRNLVLRNITISKPSGSCGVIIGDPANPINVTFDGVRFIDPKDDGAFGKDFFFAKGVNGVAMGDTYPIPPGFENRTGFQCVSGQCVPSNEGGDQASCAAVCS